MILLRLVAIFDSDASDLRAAFAIFEKPNSPIAEERHQAPHLRVSYYNSKVRPLIKRPQDVLTGAMLYGAAITLTALLALSVAVFWQPLSHRVVVLGLTRFSISNIHGDGKLVAIPGTVQCEDVHYHAASNKLYTACEGNTESRLGWFPGLHQINNISYAGYGKLVIVDPDVGNTHSINEMNAKEGRHSHHPS